MKEYTIYAKDYQEEFEDELQDTVVCGTSFMARSIFDVLDIAAALKVQSPTTYMRLFEDFMTDKADILDDEFRDAYNVYIDWMEIDV